MGLSTGWDEEEVARDSVLAAQSGSESLRSSGQETEAGWGRHGTTSRKRRCQEDQQVFKDESIWIGKSTWHDPNGISINYESRISDPLTWRGALDNLSKERKREWPIQNVRWLHWGILQKAGQSAAWWVQLEHHACRICEPWDSFAIQSGQETHGIDPFEQLDGAGSDLGSGRALQRIQSNSRHHDRSREGSTPSNL